MPLRQYAFLFLVCLVAPLCDFRFNVYSLIKFEKYPMNGTIISRKLVAINFFRITVYDDYEI